MPELPEVETVARQLDAKLHGRTVKSVELLKSGREMPRGAEFVSCLVGKKIDSIRRRAKLLVWEFSDGSAAVAHLKMTGRFVFVGKEYKPTKHDRAIFNFLGGIRLMWADVRQFGFMRCVTQEEKEKILQAYGPEPLEVKAEEMAERFTKPKTRRIKAALLDQATVAGIGNIYADEALYRAGIKPMRRLGEMKKQERIKLAEEIQGLLKESIKLRGTSANDYVDSEGKQGGFLKHLKVYGRAGEKCEKCGTEIKRMVMGQRGTHYCPKCQK